MCDDSPVTAGSGDSSDMLAMAANEVAPSTADLFSRAVQTELETTAIGTQSMPPEPAPPPPPPSTIPSSVDAVPDTVAAAPVAGQAIAGLPWLSVQRMQANLLAEMDDLSSIHGNASSASAASRAAHFASAEERLRWNHLSQSHSLWRRHQQQIQGENAELPMRPDVVNGPGRPNEESEMAGVDDEWVQVGLQEHVSISASNGESDDLSFGNLVAAEFGDFFRPFIRPFITMPEVDGDYGESSTLCDGDDLV
jgi:hypothetical protein